MRWLFVYYSLEGSYEPHQSTFLMNVMLWVCLPSGSVFDFGKIAHDCLLGILFQNLLDK